MEELKVMKNIFLVVIGVLITLFVQNFVISHFVSHNETTSKTESAYDRVMRTGVLHCAYGLWDPCVMRDPNTGKISGLIYDFMQEVGKATGLKVEYDLEIPWDSIGVALQSGKVDAHAAGIWATPARGRVMAFSHPLFFSPTVAFSRADDHRFDYNLERVNQPDITVALSDDDITTEIYKTEFPRAKVYQLPQLAPPEELLLAVATKKADVTFNSPPRLASFEKGYPGKVKIVPLKEPLRVYPDTIAVNMGDEKLLHVLNTAIDQLIRNGVMDKLVAKYKAKYNMNFLLPVACSHDWTKSN
jgi:polar amino acid transport system substrate-binding protein